MNTFAHTHTMASLLIVMSIIYFCAAPVMANDFLEEVIVTAQKREQSLQDIPIALTAFDRLALEDYGIKNIEDANLFTPNVNIVRSPSGSSGATIAIRGSVTVNPAITWEPTVGIYLDGIFLGKNIGGIFDITELERIEILRGPQGTLYGKNTVGGAINLITRKPSDTFSVAVRTTAGNYRLREGYISINTGSLLQREGAPTANISYLKTKREGLYDNKNIDPFDGLNPLVSPASSAEFNNLNNEVIRLDLLHDLTDTLEIRYVYDYSNRNNEPTMGQLTDVNQDAFDAAGANALGPLLAAYVGDIDQRPNAIGNDYAGYEKAKTFGHAFTVDYDAENWNTLGDITLRSMTSHRQLAYSDAIDIDGSTLDFFHSERDIDYDQFSQELQWLGKIHNTNYVAGFYYFKEKADVVNPIAFFSLNGAVPEDANEYSMDNSSLATFIQIDWQPIDRLTLTAGGRWTEEKRKQTIFHPGTSDTFTGLTTNIPLTRTDNSWDNLSFTVIAGYNITNEINVYAKAAEGWKSGGFNGEASTQDAFLKGYNPEEVLSLELGLKGRFLKNRVKVNTAVFQNQIEAMQFSVFLADVGASSNVDNAGKATITGFELEATGQVTDALRLSLAYGYLDTQYNEFIELGIDVKNEKAFQFAPHHTASFALNYRVGAWDWGSIDVHTDWSYKDKQYPYTSPQQNLTTSIGDYHIINMRVTGSNIAINNNSSLRLSLWGKNLTDEHYNTHAIPFNLWTVNYYGDPRTYGFDVTLDF